MQTNFQTWVNSTNTLLQQISTANSDTERVTSAIALSNHVLSLITTEATGNPDDIIGENVLELPNAERFDTWFQAHPDFVGPKAVFNLLDGTEPALQAKLYWLKKRSNALMAGAVHFTPNWEDAEWSRNENYKIGIDFFLSPDSKSFHITLSNHGKLRVLELSERLTNTDIEVLGKWEVLGPTNNMELLHSTLWESFRLQSVNVKFYKGIADAFTELHDLLVTKGKPDEEAKMFASRLLGRLIFIWFIRKMGIISTKVDYFDPSGVEQGAYYREKLERLFFETLNNPVELRSKSSHYAVDLETPYLNGGLFSPRADDWVGEELAFPEEYFSRLFAHFDDFNFTTDESTPEYEQVAIDPEMLGRVFESLLASQVEETGEQARKAKGAFYTPREVVSYMCREAVRSYMYEATLQEEQSQEPYIDLLLDKSDQDWAKDGSNSLRDIPVNSRKILLSALKGLKTLDPACGSGAFPLGLLQILTKSQMRLDPTSEPYEVKLGILQNNIYGSDIEPMAIEISKLRSWLSLIVEERQSRNVEPLPNLDFNFVSANSLIPLMEADLFTNTKVQVGLDAIRKKYFGETDPKVKLNLQVEFHKLSQPDLIDNRSNQLRTFNPFDSESISSFFDPEIMFGIENGFDIVIGNPPYVNIEKIDANTKQLAIEKYDFAYKKYDLYILFFERAVNLLKQRGVLSYITSNKWLAQEYGFVLRKKLLEGEITHLINFNVDIFDSATVRTSIINWIKKPNQVNAISVLDIQNKSDAARFENLEFTQIEQQVFHTTFANNFRLNLTVDKSELIRKIQASALRLEEICSLNYGLRPSGKTDSASKKDRIFSEPGPGRLPYFEGKQLGKSIVKSFFYIHFEPEKMYNPMFPELFSNPKLVGLCTLSDISKFRFGYDDKGYLCNASVVVITPWFSFENVDYASVRRNISHSRIQNSRGYNLAYIQGVLNSDVPKFIFNEMLYDGTHFYPDQMKSIPIPRANLEEQNEIASLVIGMRQAELEGDDAAVSVAQLQINKLVAPLYGLARTELELVHQSLPNV